MSLPAVTSGARGCSCGRIFWIRISNERARDCPALETLSPGARLVCRALGRGGSVVRAAARVALGLGRPARQSHGAGRGGTLAAKPTLGSELDAPAGTRPRAGGGPYPR